jgi:hypothetical protein
VVLPSTTKTVAADGLIEPVEARDQASMGRGRAVDSHGRNRTRVVGVGLEVGLQAGEPGCEVVELPTKGAEDDLDRPQPPASEDL